MAIKRNKSSGFELNYNDLNNFTELNFSKNAFKKIKSSELNFSQKYLERLLLAVSRAETKNAQTSLIIMDNTAYLVSIENNIVITFFENYQEREIYNDIDSIVFM
jgi:flagellar operon protein